MPPRDESQSPFPTYPPPRTSAAGLSPADQAHLASNHKKKQVLRDRSASVAYGRTPGAYIFGSGGIGKSHTILADPKVFAGTIACQKFISEVGLVFTST